MGLFDFFKKKNQSVEVSPNIYMGRDELVGMTLDIFDIANEFVEGQSKCYKGLDFSVKSLCVMDELLDDIGDVLDDLPEDKREALVTSCGSYVFEVARRNFGGSYSWNDSTNQLILVTGLPDFEVSIMAFNKVKSRIINRDEDSISFYFKGYVEYVSHRKWGLIV